MKRLAKLPDYPSTDLQGQTMVPGILDVHGHFPGEGLSAVAADLNSPPVGNLITIHNVLDRLAEEAITTKEGGW
jgi:predicted amidohydrolase YtcJ